jgi:tRNA modification GTPase
VAALITPPGRSALATVAVRGDGAVAAVARCLHATCDSLLKRTDRGRLWVRPWRDGGGEPVVVYVRSDRSVEVHCHGGSMPAETILRDLESAGVPRATVADLARRCCAGPIEAEALIALGEATTLRAADVLLGQLHGSLSRAIHQLRVALAQGERVEVQRGLSTLLARSVVGLHLVDPWRIAIVGRPNVGKSSLLNAIVGFERAIVHPTPGTTRDLVTARTAVDGWPVEFIDSAGIRSGRDAIESAGIERARQAIESSDLAIVVLDRSEPLAPEDHEIIRMCCQLRAGTLRPGTIGIYTSPSPRLRAEGEEVVELCTDHRTASVSERPLVVANKADLPAVWTRIDDQTEFNTVSAQAGTGIDELLARLAMCLVPDPPTSRDAVPFTHRQVAAVRDAEYHLRHGEARGVDELLDSLLGLR